MGSLVLLPYIVNKSIKRINKSLSFHYNLHYDYQYFFTSNKLVMRKFFQSRLIALSFRRAKRKLRYFQKKFSNLTYVFAGFLTRLRISHRLNINPLKFFLQSNLLSLKPRLSNFTLRRKIFLSTPNLTRIAADFVYGNVRDNISMRQYSQTFLRGKSLTAAHAFATPKPHKVIFYNAHKSLICKMREGRFAH